MMSRERTRRAGEEIARMRRERNAAQDALRSVCTALSEVLADSAAETRFRASEARDRAVTALREAASLLEENA